MRVYEFSKEYDFPTKELLELLQKGGFEVKSHMVALTDDAISYLHKELKKAQKEQEPEKPISKEKAAPQVKNKTLQVKSKQKSKSYPSQLASKKQELKKEMPIKITLSSMTPDQFSQNAGKPVNEIILTLLRWGIIAPKNQVLSEDVIKRLAEHYELETVRATSVVSEIKKDAITVDEGTELKERLPIVVVVGHVDHGKTTLLDYIRKTRVAAKEKGGITQHIGAYEASTPQGNIIFLDTPGHEAFGKIRQRGIKVADIVVLVVAADDGIMPQTVEAIKHAKNMNVPIIVAINKVDKVDAVRIEVVKRQLAEHDLLPEDWGGETVCIPISASLGQGVDQLLEMVALQAQLMELRADLSGLGKGYVLESKIEKGYGPVATIICQHGKVKVGDFFICDNTVGRISSLVDSFGKSVKEVGPAIPVQVAGFDELSKAGDYFEIVSKQEYRKARSGKDNTRKPFASQHLLQEKAINLIIKTDTNSSKEALLDSIERLSKKLKVPLNVLHAAIGNVNESDIELAFNTGSAIAGLHVKTEPKALPLAQRKKVKISLYDIIYKLLESLEEKVESEKEVEMVRQKIGEATVLRVFDIKGVGVVGGSIVNDGRFTREGYAIVYRNRQKVGEGKIVSLQREKKTVKEVHTGFECGFVIDGFVDFQVDDKVECYISVPKK